MIIYVTPFDDERRATAPSTDSGFETIGDVVAVMGDEHLSRCSGYVIYPGVMFSVFEVQLTPRL